MAARLSDGTLRFLCLTAALLMWAPMLGVDPLPRRLSPRGQMACLAACMAPMLLVGAWLGLAPHAVYEHYVQLGSSPAAALHDQRLAATIGARLG